MEPGEEHLKMGMALGVEGVSQLPGALSRSKEFGDEDLDGVFP